MTLPDSDCLQSPRKRSAADQMKEERLAVAMPGSLGAQRGLGAKNGGIQKKSKPVEFHFEAANFATQSIRFFARSHWRRTPATREQGLGLILNFFLPLADLN